MVMMITNTNYSKKFIMTYDTAEIALIEVIIMILIIIMHHYNLSSSFCYIYVKQGLQP